MEQSAAVRYWSLVPAGSYKLSNGTNNEIYIFNRLRPSAGSSMNTATPPSRQRLLGPVHIDLVTKEKIMSYLFWLANNKQFSETNLNTTINALKFYFEKVLGRSKEYYDLPRPRTTHKLPDVLAGEEIISLLKNIKNVKHHALIMTSYSAGLRVSDLARPHIVIIDTCKLVN